MVCGDRVIAPLALRRATTTSTNVIVPLHALERHLSRTVTVYS